ncbi:MAG: prepilin-type N-terminal cleavage/methylation domain-containing protein [bacterium]|nr:prepilin-type N-terminal cleavage/methylation domain-containing protein [bacterium]
MCVWQANPRRHAFTLVEMLTVVVIIVLILGMAVPAFTSMWDQRKQSQALNLLHGSLRTVRAKALHKSEMGLFFYVDPVTQRQMIAPIVPDAPNPDPESHEYKTDCSGELASGDPITDCITDFMAQDRFRVVEGDIHELPAPFRVAPRSILSLATWPEMDIAHDAFDQPTLSATTGWPRHRNFFTVIFGANGRLTHGRNVLIHDIALRNQTNSAIKLDGRGKRTGLNVGDPLNYYANDFADPGGSPVPLDPDGKSLYDIIVEMDLSAATPGPTQDAISFTSAGGLLLYDESTLTEIPYEAGSFFKRDHLLDAGIPLYITRMTGEVVEGPRGEGK